MAPHGFSSAQQHDLSWITRGGRLYTGPVSARMAFSSKNYRWQLRNRHHIDVGARLASWIDPRGANALEALLASTMTTATSRRCNFPFLGANSNVVRANCGPTSFTTGRKQGTLLCKSVWGWQNPSAICVRPGCTEDLKSSTLMTAAYFFFSFLIN